MDFSLPSTFVFKPFVASVLNEAMPTVSSNSSLRPVGRGSGEFTKVSFGLSSILNSPEFIAGDEFDERSTGGEFPPTASFDGVDVDMPYRGEPPVGDSAPVGESAPEGETTPLTRSCTASSLSNCTRID